MSFLKIYFQNKPFLLANEISEEIKAFDDGYLISEQIDTPHLQNLIEKIAEKEVIGIAVVYPDFEKLKNHFFELFTLQKAGGGLVVNNKNEILMILRRGVWDLPKGKLEKGENMADCALREVMEETGIHNLVVQQLLCITYHTYRENGLYILKESHWYKMQAYANESPVPQLEEQITEIKWVPKSDVRHYLANSFEAIKDVVTNMDSL